MRSNRPTRSGCSFPLLEGLDIAGKTISADALLIQRKLARHLVEQRAAHYLFTVKDNQPMLLADIRLLFEDRGEPDFREPLTLEHGRLESRAIWTTIRLNDYLNCPYVGQAFAIKQYVIETKTGKVSTETDYGLTDHHPQSADAARLLASNRAHWGVEAHHCPSSTGTGTKTAAPCGPATARKTSLACAALPPG